MDEDRRRSSVEEMKPQARSEAEWRRMLTPLQYRVLRAHGAETAFSSPLVGERRRGIYLCAGCRHRLFDSKAKFDDASGFPSFRECLEGAVRDSEERSRFVIQHAVSCGRCGG